MTPQARGAGDEGRELANNLLTQFLNLDSRLVELLKQLGVIVDLSGVTLEPDEARTSLRPSEFHNPFGSVETDRVDQSDIDNAANAFVLEWVEAIIGQVPPDLAEKLAAATNMEEVFRILGDEVGLILIELSDSSKALYDQVYPLVGLQKQYDDVIANLGAELAANLLTQEEYDALVQQAGENFEDASRQIRIANGEILDVSDSTQAMLDALYPLEALERTRTETLSRLANELAAGVITQEQYNELVAETNENYDEGARKVAEANGEIFELSQTTQDLIDKLDPLTKLERERTERLAQLQKELDSNLLTQEQYNELVAETNNEFEEGARKIEEANGAIFELSSATQGLLDKLNPLAKLERDRNETLAQLQKELDNGLLTAEEYQQLVSAVNDEYARGKQALRENSQEFKDLVESIRTGIVEAQEARIESLNLERLAIESTLTAIEEKLATLESAGVVIGDFLGL